MVTLKEAVTKSELKQFVKFPFLLYKNNPYWVPPIINDELESFDKSKNPAFKNADAWFYLAYKNNAIVGRIAIIVNRLEINDQGIKKVRFGWFDFVDDTAVSEALIEKVIEIGSQHQLEYMEGPVGFSNMDKAGVLIKGFEELNTMITWYNYPYYSKHLEQLGFEQAATWVEYKIKIPKQTKPKVEKFARVIKERYQLQLLKLNKIKEILKYADDMFDLLNKTYSSLQTFVPIQQYQVDMYKKKYLPYLNPEYITCIADKTGKLIAFSIVMPSFSEALQKAKGKLFPFGIFHLLKARKHAKDVTFYLIGVHPDYQNKGVHAIIFDQYTKTFAPLGIENCIRTPELEDNEAIKKLWENFDPVTHKRRRTYRKSIQ